VSSQTAGPAWSSRSVRIPSSRPFPPDKGCGLPFNSTDRAKQRIKLISLLCSVLCITGFIGGTFINENLWYIAPMGYGIGFLILCVLMFRVAK